MRKIILASASPRRKELLQKYNIEFEVFITDVDESISEAISPEEFVLRISKKKVKAAVSQTHYSDAVILGADTIVTLDGVIFGKPKDKKDAAEMLRALSGRWHEVYSGVTLAFLKDGQISYKQESCCTGVKFRNLKNEEIECYVETGEPMDKAGAYAIQGIASKFIEQIDGDYENVVGLPVQRVLKLIESTGQ